MSNEFTGKTALVTGASRGIGAATAVALARAGVARLLLHYNSHRPGAEQALDQVRAAGASGELFQADLAGLEGIHALVASVRARSPEVDILVNNAGALVRRAGLLDHTEDLFDRIMNLNVKSLWFLTQAVAPHMIARAGGSIVNVSSIAARNGGGPGATIYAAAKAAVSAITKGLSKELAPQGVRVNAISPGTVDNYFHVKYSTREILDSVVRTTPAGRLGTNDDMADVVVFLCSDAARYVHGQTVEINGGGYMV